MGRFSPRLTIISGPRDSGKTATAARLAAGFLAQGLRVGGVLSEAELREGIKTSYAFVDLGSGRRVRYANRKAGSIQPGVSAYEFLDEGLAFGSAAIRRAAADMVEALFVDEIGPLEMGGGGLWEPVREIIAEFGGRAIFTVRPGLLSPLLEKLRIRRSDVEVLSPSSTQTAS